MENHQHYKFFFFKKQTDYKTLHTVGERIYFNEQILGLSS